MKDNVMTVKITGQDFLEMKSDLQTIKTMLSEGNGKISSNRKMIYGAYAGLAMLTGFLITFMVALI